VLWRFLRGALFGIGLCGFLTIFWLYKAEQRVTALDG
jgi:hypothetical protein